MKFTSETGKAIILSDDLLKRFEKVMSIPFEQDDFDIYYDIVRKRKGKEFENHTEAKSMIEAEITKHLDMYG